MMAPPMTLAKAREIAHAISIGVAKFGPQLSPPYRPSDILQALVTLEKFGNWDAPDHAAALAEAREAVTLANRRAGAAESRVKRMLKRQDAERDPEQPEE